MFSFRDLFQWERFITPSIIKLFYWLALGIIVLFGLTGAFFLTQPQLNAARGTAGTRLPTSVTRPGHWTT